MAHKIADRVKETASTTGTGAFTLAGAVSGFDTFASVLTADGDTSWYSAVNGSEWEVGLCTRTSSTTYARTTVLSSSNSDALVSFTAAPTVFCTLPASRLPGVNGPAFRAVSNAVQTYSTGTHKVNFGAETCDTNSCFDTSNSRFTPAVAGYYSFHALLTASQSTGSQVLPGAASVHLYKNGSSHSIGVQATTGTMYRISVSDTIYLNGSTDYVEVYVISASASLENSYFAGHLVRVG